MSIMLHDWYLMPDAKRFFVLFLFLFHLLVVSSFSSSDCIHSSHCFSLTHSCRLHWIWSCLLRFSYTQLDIIAFHSCRADKPASMFLFWLWQDHMRTLQVNYIHMQIALWLFSFAWDNFMIVIVPHVYSGKIHISETERNACTETLLRELFLTILTIINYTNCLSSRKVASIFPICL